jgi:hypothetical protein
MPSKPNRKTRLTNQLRLNSKALFDPSLKEKNPIVIEDQDTDEDLSEFSNMEEMAIHTLKGMTGDKTRHKCSEGETSGVKYVVVKTEYIVDPEPEQNVVDTGPDPEQDSDDISPDTEQVPEQILQDIKPEIKGKMLMVHEPVRDTTDKKPEKSTQI